MLATISSLDILVIHAVQSIGPVWIPVANLLSDIIGSTVYLAPAIILTLLAIGKRRTALEVSIIFLVSALVVYGLKHLITADRPYWVDASVFGYAIEDGYGMPSGHALISLVTLGWLWMRHPRSHSLSMGIPTILVLIGLSRIYLGVHYPSQVVAGWLVGGVLLAIFIWMDRKYFRRRNRFVRSSAKLR